MAFLSNEKIAYMGIGAGHIENFISFKETAPTATEYPTSTSVGWLYMDGGVVKFRVGDGSGTSGTEYDLTDTGGGGTMSSFNWGVSGDTTVINDGESVLLGGTNDISVSRSSNTVNVSGSSLLPLSGSRSMTGDLNLGSNNSIVDSSSNEISLSTGGIGISAASGLVIQLGIAGTLLLEIDSSMTTIKGGGSQSYVFESTRLDMNDTFIDDATRLYINEAAGDPSVGANFGVVYCKDDGSGNTDLYYDNSTEAVVKLT